MPESDVVSNQAFGGTRRTLNKISGDLDKHPQARKQKRCSRLQKNAEAATQLWGAKIKSR
jgi:hypothetical protein